MRQSLENRSWSAPRAGVLILLSLLLIGLSWQGAGCQGFHTRAVPPAPTEPVFTPLWGPYLTGTDTTSTVINVKLSSPAAVTVQYSQAADYVGQQGFAQQIGPDAPEQFHHIQLSGLIPGQSYYYRVLCQGYATPVYKFSTFPRSGAFSFIVYGDNQDELPHFSQAERHQLVAERIAREEDALFVLNVGDLVNDGEDLANWDRYFQASRSLGARLPVFPARGNHDGAGLYYDIFGVKPFYAFECAAAHFTILDTIDEPPGQTDWLKTQLDHELPGKFVVCHYPLYTSEANHFGGWENLQQEWADIFQAHRVKAVWSGHIHAYERYLQKGIMYSVVGTGGGPYDVLAMPRCPGHQNSRERILGYARVTVAPNGQTASVQYIQVAEVSEDGKTVTLLPPGTILETYQL